MAKRVVVILDISQNFTTARFEHMSCELFSRRFSRTAGYRHDGPIPFAIYAMREPLKCRDSVIHKKEPVEKRFKVCSVFLESIATQNARCGAFFKSGRHVPGRIFEIAVETIISVFGL